MIQIFETPVGVNGISIGNKSLCSRRDPLTEAKQWTMNYSSKAANHEYICVIGAGAGWHLQCLSLAHPTKQIIALDIYKEVQSFIEINHETRKFKIEIIDDINSIITDPQFKELLKKRPLVLPFFPSWQSNPEGYEKIMAIMTGRDEASLKILSELVGFHSKYSIQNKKGKFISVLDVETSDPNWQILKEMVK